MYFLKEWFKSVLFGINERGPDGILQKDINNEITKVRYKTALGLQRRHSVNSLRPSPCLLQGMPKG